MKPLVFCLLLAFAATQQIVNPPELKIAFNYNQIDMIKNNILMPFVQLQAQNLPINASVPINSSISSGSIGNLTLLTLDVDWAYTQLLTPYIEGNNLTSVKISNLSGIVNFDMDVTVDVPKIQPWPITLNAAGNNLTVQGVDIELVIGYGKVSAYHSYAYISDSSLEIGAVDLVFNNEISIMADKLMNDLHINFGSIISGIINKAILNLNETIINKTAAGLSIEILDMFQLNASIAELPFIFNYANEPYQSFSVNFALEDTVTHQIAPQASSDQLPSFINDELPYQIIVSEEMISQVLWAVFRSGKLNVTISQKDLEGLGKKVPVTLYTTALIILFPDIAKDFGENKGVYMNIQKGGDYPMSFIRDGRLVLDLAIALDVWVDEDSSQYPDQGLAGCTTCSLAYALNITAFVALDVYKINSTAIGASVMNVILNKIERISGNIDPVAFQGLLNGLLLPILNGLNVQLGDGIAIPMIQVLGLLYGLNDTSIAVGENYLVVGFELEYTTIPTLPSMPSSPVYC